MIAPLDDIALHADLALPALAHALDPKRAEAEVGRAIRPLVPGGAHVTLLEQRVLAYKPQRRCVIAYRFGVRCGTGHSLLAVIGKMRARKNGVAACRQLRSVWDSGFEADSHDGISVPEPIGVVPAFDMWLQRSVEGTTLTELLGGPDGVSLGRRTAEAAHKLHAAGIPATHRHTIADELRILDRCFAVMAAAMPEVASRLARLADACHRVGAALPEPAWCGSHRDFYSDQVVVDPHGRQFLLDFDLYCEADPGLDIGNFLGHVTEYSLRCLGDARALEPVERALERRCGELAGEAVRVSARAYAVLTVARHVYLSTRFADRRRTTAPLLDLAERRLLSFAAEGGHA